MTTDSPQNEIWCKSCCQSYYQLHLGVRLLSVVLLSCQLMNFVLTSLSLRRFGRLYATRGGLLDMRASLSLDRRKLQFLFAILAIKVVTRGIRYIYAHAQLFIRLLPSAGNWQITVSDCDGTVSSNYVFLQSCYSWTSVEGKYVPGINVNCNIHQVNYGNDQSLRKRQIPKRFFGSTKLINEVNSISPKGQ